MLLLLGRVLRIKVLVTLARESSSVE